MANVKTTKMMTKMPPWLEPGRVLASAEYSVVIGTIPAAIIPIGFEMKVLSMNIDENAITEAGDAVIRQKMAQLAGSLKLALDTALRSPVWSWTGGARDIIDTGELMSSGSVTVSGTSLSISYDAPYANLVHNGGYIYPYGNKSARPIYLPGRPWISATINGGGPVPKWEPDFT